MFLSNFLDVLKTCYSHLYYNGHCIASKEGQKSRLIPSFPLFPYMRKLLGIK